MKDHLVVGFKSNARPSTTCFNHSGQGVTRLECDGAEDESHLSFVKFIQYGCDEEVPNRRMLGSISRCTIY